MHPVTIARAILNDCDGDPTTEEAIAALTKDVIKAMVRKVKDGGSVDAARWLEENAKDALPLQDMLTPIIVSAKKGNVDAVRWLKEHKWLNLE